MKEERSQNYSWDFPWVGERRDVLFTEMQKAAEESVVKGGLESSHGIYGMEFLCGLKDRFFSFI